MDAAGSGDAAGLNPYVGGSAGLNGGSGGGATPVSAVTASNAAQGRQARRPGHPRRRAEAAARLPRKRPWSTRAAPVKAPKLRNGNLNNPTTSNVRVPYSRV